MFEFVILLASATPFLLGLYAIKLIRDSGNRGSDDPPPPPDPEPPRPFLPPGPSQQRPRAGDRTPRRPHRSRTPDRPARVRSR